METSAVETWRDEILKLWRDACEKLCREVGGENLASGRWSAAQIPAPNGGTFIILDERQSTVAKLRLFISEGVGRNLRTGLTVPEVAWGIERLDPATGKPISWRPG